METNGNEAGRKNRTKSSVSKNTINRVDDYLLWVLIGNAVQTCLTVRCLEDVVLCQRHLRPTLVEYFLPLFCSE